MFRKTLLFLFLIWLLVPVVNAENGGATPIVTKIIPTLTQEQIAAKQAYIEKMKAEKAALLESMKATEAVRKQQFLEKITLTPKPELLFEKTPLREQIEPKLPERENLLEQKRAKFKERVGQLENERKQKILEHLDEQLNQINKRLVEQLLQKTERLAQLLDKLKKYAVELKSQGADTTEVESLIAQAQTDLETFKKALELQANKDYTPVLSVETNFKLEVGQVHQALRNDLDLLRTDLMAMKNQLVSIAKQLKMLNLSLVDKTKPLEPTVVPTLE